jgi:tRNA dimethylallyltransferase
MESQPDQPPVVVIVGETGSGKSALALELARQYDGEIIATDSRTIYKGMDIGTAKPSRAERALVPHHLIDIVTPDTLFTAADFKHRAQAAIADIASRGKLPLIVGGSGLYVDALVYDFSFAAKADAAERARLQTMDVAALQAELQERGIPFPSNDKNPRHLIRQLESGGMPAGQRTLRNNTLIIGVRLERTALEERIYQRVRQMFLEGVEQEVHSLARVYGWDCPGLRTIGYQEFQPFFAGKAAYSEVQAAIGRNTLRYAKRQRTWFQRNKSIHWLSKREDAVDLITSFLNK